MRRLLGWVGDIKPLWNFGHFACGLLFPRVSAPESPSAEPAVTGSDVCVRPTPHVLDGQARPAAPKLRSIGLQSRTGQEAWCAHKAACWCVYCCYLLEAVGVLDAARVMCVWQCQAVLDCTELATSSAVACCQPGFSVTILQSHKSVVYAALLRLEVFLRSCLDRSDAGLRVSLQHQPGPRLQAMQPTAHTSQQATTGRPRLLTSLPPPAQARSLPACSKKPWARCSDSSWQCCGQTRWCKRATES